MMHAKLLIIFCFLPAVVFASLAGRITPPLPSNWNVQNDFNPESQHENINIRVPSPSGDHELFIIIDHEKNEFFMTSSNCVVVMSGPDGVYYEGPHLLVNFSLLEVNSIFFALESNEQSVDELRDYIVSYIDRRRRPEASPPFYEISLVKPNVMPHQKFSFYKATLPTSWKYTRKAISPSCYTLSLFDPSQVTDVSSVTIRMDYTNQKAMAICKHAAVVIFQGQVKGTFIDSQWEGGFCKDDDNIWIIVTMAKDGSEETLRKLALAGISREKMPNFMARLSSEVAVIEISPFADGFIERDIKDKTEQGESKERRGPIKRCFEENPNFTGKGHTNPDERGKKRRLCCDHNSTEEGHADLAKHYDNMKRYGCNHNSTALRIESLADLLTGMCDPEDSEEASFRPSNPKRLREPEERDFKEDLNFTGKGHTDPDERGKKRRLCCNHNSTEEGHADLDKHYKNMKRFGYNRDVTILGTTPLADQLTGMCDPEDSEEASFRPNNPKRISRTTCRTKFRRRPQLYRSY